MKLSILIPTLPDDRSRTFLKRMNLILDRQIARHHGQVEKCIDDRGKHIPTGTKRNDLINYASGDYHVFVDVDDWVASNYVDLIMEGIEKGVDVVTMQGWMTTNGGHHVDWIIKLGERYEERGGKYYRFPNHLCAFRSDLVSHIKFPAIWKGEDFQWAKKVHDSKVLKTEHHIEKQIYHYMYVSSK